MSSISVADLPKVNQAVQKVTQIATLPEITAKIIEIVEDPRSTAKDLQTIIKHDVALSAKILKVVNSAFYGLPRQVGSVDRAVVLLGLSTVKNIAVATSITKLFRGAGKAKHFSPKNLWMHSLACGVFCKLIAESLKTENGDEIFVAGLMHDLGILVEFQVYPDELSRAIENSNRDGTSLRDAETELFGTDHQTFGTALAMKWKFPHLFQSATGYHHQPLKTAPQHRAIASAVHLADALANQQDVGFHVERGNYQPEVLEILEIREEDLGTIIDAFGDKFAAANAVMQ